MRNAMWALRMNSLSLRGILELGNSRPISKGSKNGLSLSKGISGGRRRNGTPYDGAMIGRTPSQDPFKEGVKAATPIILGYLPVGFAFGVLARKAGLTPLEVGLMSFLVYAGSSQFIAVEMLSKGVMWFPIVVTTLFVNLRYLLMSSTLSLYVNRQPLRRLLLISAQLTDESFAVAMLNRLKVTHRPRYLLGLQMVSQLAWIGGTVGGAIFGSFINPEGYGLPFALPALFVCLLVMQLKSPLYVGMMMLAGISSLIFKWAFPGNWYIVLASVLTSGIGAMIEVKRQEKVSVGDQYKNSKPSIQL